MSTESEKTSVVVIDRKALRAAAEAARGVNLTRPKGKHLPFSMNPEGVLALLDLAECWATSAQRAERSRDEAWQVCDDARMAMAAAVKRQADLEAVNAHLRERNEVLVNSERVLIRAHQALQARQSMSNAALKLAHAACVADREERSSDACKAIDEAYPLICQVLGLREHEPGAGCEVPGCEGFGHTAKAATVAAEGAAKEEAPDAQQA